MCDLQIIQIYMSYLGRTFLSNLLFIGNKILSELCSRWSIINSAQQKDKKVYVTIRIYKY